MTTQTCKYDGCNENIWNKSNNDFCLFHDPQIGKKNPSKIKKHIIRNNIYDFTGFKLPGNIIFKDGNFNDELNFEETLIEGVLIFKNCEFVKLKI